MLTCQKYVVCKYRESCGFIKLYEWLQWRQLVIDLVIRDIVERVEDDATTLRDRRAETSHPGTEDHLWAGDGVLKRWERSRTVNPAVSWVEARIGDLNLECCGGSLCASVSDQLEVACDAGEDPVGHQ